MLPDLERAVARFSTRSSKRDAAIDEARIELLEESIDTAIRGLIAERTGLAPWLKRFLDEPEALKRDEIWMNRHRALACCLRMIFPENRFALFRIML